MSVKLGRSSVINVPIKPHLKKFFLKTYHLSEPVKVEEDSLLGNYVMSILLDKRAVSGKLLNILDSQYNGSGSDLLSDTLQVTLSQSMMERSPRIGKLVRINLFLQHSFRQAVIIYIKACIASGVNAYTACKQFLKLYEFDESEYSLDGVHQIWKRYQAAHVKKNRSAVPKKPERSTKVLQSTSSSI